MWKSSCSTLQLCGSAILSLTFHLKVRLSQVQVVKQHHELSPMDTKTTWTEIINCRTFPHSGSRIPQSQLPAQNSAGEPNVRSVSVELDHHSRLRHPTGSWRPITRPPCQIQCLIRVHLKHSKPEGISCSKGTLLILLKLLSRMRGQCLKSNDRCEIHMRFTSASTQHVPAQSTIAFCTILLVTFSDCCASCGMGVRREKALDFLLCCHE